MPPPRMLVLANLHLVLGGKQKLTLIGESNRLCNQLRFTFLSHNFLGSQMFRVCYCFSMFRLVYISYIKHRMQADYS